jgi:glyoxylase-like metal-dependent hydrolase (beta-lactamase superfamily II)
LIRVARHVNTLLEVNTYIVYGDSGAAIVIDPGSDVDEYLKLARQLGARVELIVATHLHPDHVIGLNQVARRTGALIAYCVLDKPAWKALARLARLWGLNVIEEEVPDPDLDLCSVDSLRVDDVALQPIPAPGHSPGSVVLYEPLSMAAFTGDVIFMDGVGRVDFPYSDPEAMKATLDLLKAKLPREAKLYPGHGPATTMERELLLNPFLSGYASLQGG